MEFDQAELDRYETELGQPSETVLMERQLFGSTEIMWAHAYPFAKVLIFTFLPVTLPGGAEMPGVVVDQPVGFRDMASPDTLRAKLEKSLDAYRQHGWKRAGDA